MEILSTFDGRRFPTSILFTCNILDRNFNLKKYDIKYQENSRNQFSLDYGYAVVISKFIVTILLIQSKPFLYSLSNHRFDSTQAEAQPMLNNTRACL